MLAVSTSFAASPAPSPDHAPVALSEVVVSAHPYAKSQFELAQPTSVLSGRQLSLRQAASLGDLLAHEVGTSSTWFGPGAGRPIIRGLGGDRLRVLQNGIGTLDASITSPDHAIALDPLLIERVEIVRGPASLLYGSSAVGGAVNVITHRVHQAAPEAALEGRLEARVGTVNEERSAGLVLEGGNAGPFAWHLDAYRRRSGDVRIPGFARSDRLRAEEDHEPEILGRIPNTAITADGGAAGVSFVGASGYIGFAFSGHNTLYGVPPGAHGHAHEEEEEEPGVDEPVRIDLRQRRLDLEGEWNVPLDGLRRTKFKLGRADYRHQELEGDAIGTVFTNDGHEGRLELLHEPAGPFTGAFGLQLARNVLDALGEEAFLPASRTQQAALFLFEEAERGAVTWQVGARAERQKISLLDRSQRRRSDRAISLSTGMVWTWSEAWSLAASLTRTQRPPNAQELYADGPHVGTGVFERGDPALAREGSLGLDVSLRRRTGRITGSLTAFLNRFDGYIFQEPTGQLEDGLEVHQYAQRDARFVGGEFEGVIHLHEGEERALDLSLTADLVRARQTDDGANLPRITPPRARVALNWHRGPFSIGGELQRVFDQGHAAPNESPTSEYTLLSAYAGWRFNVGTAAFDLFARGTNLGDREARVHTSFLKEVAPLPGRNVSLALRCSF